MARNANAANIPTDAPATTGTPGGTTGGPTGAVTTAVQAPARQTVGVATHPGVAVPQGSTMNKVAKVNAWIPTGSDKRGSPHPYVETGIEVLGPTRLVFVGRTADNHISQYPITLLGGGQIRILPGVELGRIDGDVPAALMA